MDMIPSEFARMLDIVKDWNFDANKIVLAMVKDDPIYFLKIYDSMKSNFIDPDCQRIFNEIVSDNKIGAIRLVREKFSLSLKDAKDVVENLIDYLVGRGKLPDYVDTAVPAMPAGTLQYNAYLYLIKQLDK